MKYPNFIIDSNTLQCVQEFVQHSSVALGLHSNWNLNELRTSITPHFSLYNYQSIYDPYTLFVKPITAHAASLDIFCRKHLPFPSLLWCTIINESMHSSQHILQCFLIYSRFTKDANIGSILKGASRLKLHVDKFLSLGSVMAKANIRMHSNQYSDVLLIRCGKHKVEV